MSADDIQIIISEVTLDAKSLIQDVFGNYVIQKLLEFGTTSQRATLIHQLIGHMVELSMHMYGCRVVQKAIELG